MKIPQELINAIASAKHVVAMTGAGVSAESGVPTFRDAQTGMWEKFEPTELATPQAFQSNPELVWKWYQWRRELISNVEPNPGHLALFELQNLVSKFTLLTQNVDGLHQQVGNDEVVELHGSIVRAKCFDQNHMSLEWPDDSKQQPPVCQECGSLMRPDVVWFNESLPQEAIESAVAATSDCDVFLSIGTSSVVYPAASLAFSAVENGAVTVEINPNPTPLTTEVTYSLPGPSGEVLPLIIQALREMS